MERVMKEGYRQLTMSANAATIQVTDSAARPVSLERWTSDSMAASVAW